MYYFCVYIQLLYYHVGVQEMKRRIAIKSDSFLLFSMKKIEIYDYETNEVFATIETRKKNLQLEAINYLKQNNFRLLLKGIIDLAIQHQNVYWLSYNSETKEELKLWYREAEKEKTNSNMNKEDLELSM